MGPFGPQELIILLVVLIALFGSSQLPKLARSLVQARREFQSGVQEEIEAPSNKRNRKRR